MWLNMTKDFISILTLHFRYSGGELEGQGGGATIANAREQVGYLSSLKEMGLLNSLWFAMSSILNQGSDMLPQYDSLNYHFKK